MPKRKTKIIKDGKKRGEWAESLFMARANENGLPVCKPLGDSDTFDCVVGRPGKFVGVQVKCTMARRDKGYRCAVTSTHRTYHAGSFDFVAAYVIPEDVWYIIPEKLIRGKWAIALCTPSGRFELYREAWHLLKEVAAEEEPEPAPVAESPVMARMRASFGFMRRRWGLPEEE